MTGCASCGRPLTSPNPRARYCDSTCRAAACLERKRRGEWTPDTVRRPRSPALVAVPADPDVEGPPSVAAAVRVVLEEADRVETPLGAAALTIAARMDRGIDTASAIASAAKQLEATLRAALDGAVGVSTMDRLRAGRDAKRHA